MSSHFFLFYLKTIILSKYEKYNKKTIYHSKMRTRGEIQIRAVFSFAYTEVTLLFYIIKIVFFYEAG